MSFVIARRCLGLYRCSSTLFPNSLRYSSYLSNVDPEDERSDQSTLATPWVRSVVSGVGLMRNSKYNKGLAFSKEERDRLYLRGLLPPATLSQEVQAERVMLNLDAMDSDVAKHTYLMSLQERNERLFYYVIQNNIESLLPLLQYKTTSAYCQRYSLMFRSLPRGLFLSLQDKGHIKAILKNWPERRVKAICLTDGENVGTVGDLGVQAIGVPISRLALYTAAGGLDPSCCLPVVIDAGTDTEALLQDPIYCGARHRRVRGDAYYELVDEFFSAVHHRYGASVLVHLEDMAFDTEHKLVNSYRGMFPVYSDAHFGLAATVLAAIFAALGDEPLIQQRLVLVGESPTLIMIAELFEEAVQQESRKRTILEARESIFLVDSKGLVSREREDADELADHKLPYIQDLAPCPDLLSTVKAVKPTIIIAMSDDVPHHALSEQVCREISSYCPRPILLPLSKRSPTGALGGGELCAKDAYAWTDGKCWFADRHSGNEEVILANGEKRCPREVNTVNIFPGIGLSSLMARSTKLREDMLVEAARALSRLVSDEDKALGALYPPTSMVRETAVNVASAVAAKAYHVGVATELPRPHDLMARAHYWMYKAEYRKYR